MSAAEAIRSEELPSRGGWAREGRQPAIAIPHSTHCAGRQHPGCVPLSQIGISSPNVNGVGRCAALTCGGFRGTPAIQPGKFILFSKS